MPLDPGSTLQDGAAINRSTATGAPLIVVPTDGATIKLLFEQRVVYVAPVAALNALTIVLPSMLNPGGVVTISFGEDVGGLTVMDVAGIIVDNAVGPSGSGIEYRYLGPPRGWVRWR